MKMPWRLAWLLTYPWAKFFFRLEIKGRERLIKGAQILAVNHTSNFDPLIVGWATGREIYFLAKEELFRYRPFAWLIKSWNALPVRRGGMDIRAFRVCHQILRRRKTLVLFPEGTRSPTGELGVFKPGVGMIAIMSRVPVVPVFISGVNRSILSYWFDRDFVHMGWRQKPKECSPIKVTFGEPILPNGFSLSRKSYEEFTRLVEERVRALANVNS
ncbi:MAG: lysophospholipid acyltransferase family protein [candidate division WOR-3 bacterium]